MSDIVARFECVIDASVQRVWDVLIDVGGYPTWNPFILAVEMGEKRPIVGVEMRFTVQFPGSQSTTTSWEKVTKFDPPEQNQGQRLAAEWHYVYTSLPSKIGMIKATRIQRLTEQEGGRTHYFTQESFTGWGARFVPLEDVQNGFEAQARALKMLCESS